MSIEGFIEKTIKDQNFLLIALKNTKKVLK